VQEHARRGGLSRSLEARLGKFVDAETIKARVAQKAYRKKPLVNTQQLWQEYTAERDARRKLDETKRALIRAETIERIGAAKMDAANRRLTARLLFKGLARQANCFAINVALGHTIRAIYPHADQQYQDLAKQTRRLSWLDWLQAKAENGRADALEALRRARRSSPVPKSLTPANPIARYQPGVPGSSGYQSKVQSSRRWQGMPSAAMRQEFTSTIRIELLTKW
jgi:hypothetical protein